MNARYYLVGDPRSVEDISARIEDTLDGLKRRYNIVLAYGDSHRAAYLEAHTWMDFSTRDRFIRLINDPSLPARYLIVETPSAEETERFGAELGKHMSFISLRDLQRQARRNMANDPASLVRLAIGTSETFDQTTFDILRAGLRHSNAEVREAAATGVGMIRWPEFVPELEELHESEPVAETRAAMDSALEACRQPDQQDTSDGGTE